MNANRSVDYDSGYLLIRFDRPEPRIKDAMRQALPKVKWDRDSYQWRLPVSAYRPEEQAQARDFLLAHDFVMTPTARHLLVPPALPASVVNAPAPRHALLSANNRDFYIKAVRSYGAELQPFCDDLAFIDWDYFVGYEHEHSEPNLHCYPRYRCDGLLVSMSFSDPTPIVRCVECGTWTSTVLMTPKFPGIKLNAQGPRRPFAALARTRWSCAWSHNQPSTTTPPPRGWEHMG